MGEQFMNLSGFLQGIYPLVNLSVTCWLIGWIYTLFKKRERSLQEEYEAKKELLVAQVKMRDEEIAQERRAHERYIALVEDQRRIWELQRKTGLITNRH